MSKSYKEDNRPSIQFYLDDWMKEPALRLGSLECKGLWFDMLCIMWFGQPRGTLTVNGKPLDIKGLAKIEGESVETIDRILAELETNKVYSRLQDGTIYNRRMYSEWQNRGHLSDVRSKAGKKGARKRWQNHGKPKAKMATSASSPPSSSPSKNISCDNGKKDKHKESDCRSGGAKHISDFIPSVLKKLPPAAENLPIKTQKIIKRALGIDDSKEVQEHNKQQTSKEKGK